MTQSALKQQPQQSSAPPSGGVWATIESTFSSFVITPLETLGIGLGAALGGIVISTLLQGGL